MLITAANSHQNYARLKAALLAVTSLHLSSIKYPPQTCVYDGQAYDFVVVGAGTAGSVIANRLSEDAKVLLIEAGGDPPIESNLLSLMVFGKSENNAWKDKIMDLNGEALSETNKDMSLGKALGGSSSNGFLWYTTGHKDDFNYWAKNTSDSTWKWKNVLPYFKKSQKVSDPELRKSDGKYFGKNGNIGLTVIRSAGDISEKPYLNILKEAGNPIVSDVSGHVKLGYSSGLFTVLNNERQSTANCYLSPKAKSTNLYILKNATVTKIIFDACKNAIGVKVYIADCGKRHVYIKAKIEVILSAGVVNSPKILMLSGIGPKKELSRHKIHTIADLPVGKGLQDSVGVVLVANMSKLVTPLRPFNPGSYPASVIIGFGSPSDKGGYPGYLALLYMNSPKFLINYCTTTYGLKDNFCDDYFKTDVNTQMMFIIIHKLNTKSRGNITIKSNDFRDSPIVYGGYYTDKKDLEEQAQNVKHFMKILKTKTFKELGGKFKVPKLSKCGKFDAGSLDYWKCYSKSMMLTSHLNGGTCAMGSVLDSQFRVHHVKRLRVVDASAMPRVPAGGTMGATIMMAEKAADMIKKDRKKHKCYSF